MKIGIDIDGVLNSQYDFCIEYGTRYCNEMGKYKLENTDVLDTTDMFMWGEETAHKFWNKYRKDLVVTLPAKPFAAEVISKLKDERNDIYIITARKIGDNWWPKDLAKDTEEITKKWLAENNIYYDEIAFDVIDKGTYCKENNIDIMIEDEPQNIRKLIGSTEVIVFDYQYNRQDEFKNLIRAYSWYDTYIKINEYKEQ